MWEMVATCTRFGRWNSQGEAAIGSNKPSSYTLRIHVTGGSEQRVGLILYCVSEI